MEVPKRIVTIVERALTFDYGQVRHGLLKS
jgi:hypothetical protein